tara:strand:+ start:330 stop:563 length:234 start_codon:yes stop_codon:yes gene_type:complete
VVPGKATSDPKLIDVPLTVPTIALPLVLSLLSAKTITDLLLLLSKTALILVEFPELKTTSLPKLIDVPLTVPTIAVP